MPAKGRLSGRRVVEVWCARLATSCLGAAVDAERRRRSSWCRRSRFIWRSGFSSALAHRKHKLGASQNRARDESRKPSHEPREHHGPDGGGLNSRKRSPGGRMGRGSCTWRGEACRESRVVVCCLSFASAWLLSGTQVQSRPGSYPLNRTALLLPLFLALTVHPPWPSPRLWTRCSTA
jgi:hypothetical protein